MNELGFRADQKIIDVVNQGRFTLSAEIIPPRNGAEQNLVLEQVKTLINAGAKFLSVTKGAGGSLRGGSLPIAQAIKEQFKVPCIAHFTCRDLTPQDVENQLMDHHYFGIRNILALRGDPPTEQKDWRPLPGSHTYAFQLIEQIQKLNRGAYLPREGGPPVEKQENTDFCIGAAVYPEHADEQERIDFFKKKIDSGACYAITQMVFDPEVYGRFMDLCQKHDIDVPVLPGTRLLKSQKAALLMRDRFYCSVTDNYIQALPEKNDPNQLDHCLELFFKVIDRLKTYGAPGIHLFVLNDTKGSAEVLTRYQ